MLSPLAAAMSFAATLSFSAALPYSAAALPYSAAALPFSAELSFSAAQTLAATNAYSGVVASSAALPFSAAALSSAAALAEPVEGAFGVSFGQPVPATVLAATIGEPPYPRLPGNLAQVLAVEGDATVTPNNPAGEDDNPRTGWYYLTAPHLPERLRAADARILGLLTAEGQPVRLVAQVDGAACGELYTWLLESLTRKYAAEGDLEAAAQAPYLRSARFSSSEAQIDVSCGRDLVLEYTYVPALGQWREEQAAAQEARLAEQKARERVAREISQAQARVFADTFTLGDKFRLDGGLGVVFGQPLDTAVAHVADVPFVIYPPGVPAELAGGMYEVMLDPQDHPVELRGRIPDPHRAIFDKLTEALLAKFGAPMKNGTHHKIFRVNGNFFILRAMSKSGRTDISIIDGRARRALAEREKAREAAALAAREAEFDKETKGL